MSVGKKIKRGKENLDKLFFYLKNMGMYIYACGCEIHKGNSHGEYQITRVRCSVCVTCSKVHLHSDIVSIYWQRLHRLCQQTDLSKHSQEIQTHDTDSLAVASTVMRRA